MIERVFVLVTRPLSEQLVMDDLGAKGFAVWTPIVRKWTRSPAGKKVRQARALLPRHVFFSTDDLARDFDAVRHGRWVTGILGRESPLPMSVDSHAWLAGLVVCEANGGFDYTGDKRPKCTINQMVRIVGGAFRGYTGTLVAITPKDFEVQVDGRHVRGRVTTSSIELETGETVNA